MYRVVIEDLVRDEERDSDLFPRLDLRVAKENADFVFNAVGADEQVNVRHEKDERVWVISYCKARGCDRICRFEPLHPDQGGFCSECIEAFCDDHLSDQCAHGDDGSGQFVTDLPDVMCEDCHEAYHEPPEY